MRSRWGLLQRMSHAGVRGAARVVPLTCHDVRAAGRDTCGARSRAERGSRCGERGNRKRCRLLLGARGAVARPRAEKALQRLVPAQQLNSAFEHHPECTRLQHPRLSVHLNRHRVSRRDDNLDGARLGKSGGLDSRDGLDRGHLRCPLHRHHLQQPIVVSRRSEAPLYFASPEISALRCAGGHRRSLKGGWGWSAPPCKNRCSESPRPADGAAGWEHRRRPGLCVR